MNTGSCILLIISRRGDLFCPKPFEAEAYVKALESTTIDNKLL